MITMMWKKKIVREANEGWLGITDKYWMAAVVPKKEKILNQHFCIKMHLKRIIF